MVRIRQHHWSDRALFAVATDQRLNSLFMQFPETIFFKNVRSPINQRGEKKKKKKTAEHDRRARNSFSTSLVLGFSFQIMKIIATIYMNMLTKAVFCLDLRSNLLISVSEALFRLCRGTNIYNSFWGASEFQDTYHGFLYFLTFSIFLSGFFILLVREKHRKTLYRFLLANIKGWDRNNRDKNSEHDNK